MTEVVGISFKEGGKVYFFSPGKYNLSQNTTVIVETERGQQFGKVVQEKRTIEQNQLKSEIKEVLRIASKEDFQHHLKNISDAQEALKKCRELVESEKINMQIIDATYTFDRSQLMFRFLADNRVDFRNLAKELAGIYRTRIELRQVGARDKAKEISGCGVCGLKLCCSKFLDDLESVSINMAKNQSLSLNPSKINGVCGRLLCCLKYEDENYCMCKKNLPQLGSTVKIEQGSGKVVNVDILKMTYKVDIIDKGIIEVRCNENK